MAFHYCDLSPDCGTCKVPFCPYEKWEDYGQDDEYEEEYEEQDEGDYP
jgi:hypothetical protein